MWLKFVSKDLKSKGGATFCIGEQYTDSDGGFHYFHESILESTHANYFNHSHLEELRLLEIEVLDPEPYELPYEKNSFTTREFKILREVEYREVLSEAQIEKINNKVRIENNNSLPVKNVCYEKKPFNLARLKGLWERE